MLILLKTGNTDTIPKEKAIEMILGINGLKYESAYMSEWGTDEFKQALIDTLDQSKPALYNTETSSYIEGYEPETLMAFLNTL